MRFSIAAFTVCFWFSWLAVEVTSLAKPDAVLKGLLNKKNEVHDVEIQMNRTVANMILKIGSRDMLEGFL
jgi:hypothetical protein